MSYYGDHIMGHSNDGWPYRVESYLPDLGSMPAGNMFDCWMIWDIREGTSRPVMTAIIGIELAFQNCRRLNRQFQNLPRYEVIRDHQADDPMSDWDEHWSVIDTWDAQDGDLRVQTFDTEGEAVALCESLNR